MPETIRRYVPPSDAAKRLHLTERTLEKWRRSGKGPQFIRCGPRTVRYDIEALDAWMAARACNSTAENGGQK